MNQVKSLILAAFLVCALGIGVRAGDIGTPGVKPAGDIGTPAAQSTLTNPDETFQTQTVGINDGSDLIASPLSFDFLLGLLTTIS
jgi:hypothetical protein